MGHVYQAVQWNGHKKVYDLLLALGVVAYLAAFLVVSLAVTPPEDQVSIPILLIRAFGSCAFLMLTIILMIGPLARLDRRFLPLLYNRRHIGVLTFVVSLFHALVVVGWYHAGGELNPLVSVFVSNARYESFVGFPFEVLGVAALVILFLMAATSHDFWLANLGPRAWKTLHMSVYAAYGLLVLHVALGVLQDEVHAAYGVATAVSFLLVAGLHLAAGLAEGRREGADRAGGDGWLSAGRGVDIPDGGAVIVTPPGGERIAVFRYDGKISALTNVCAHQMGPLGEGRIIDGCVTCPWHGFQFDPATGRAPAPFTDKIATYRVRVDAGEVYVDPRPLAPGTPVPPALLGGNA